MKWLKKLVSALSKRSKKPWACFTFQGVVEDGIIPIEFDYNDAFITQLRGIGFQGLNEEEIVQQFMISLVMPKNIEDEINSSSHPSLTSEMNDLIR